MMNMDEKDYKFCQKIMLSIFSESELVEQTLARFSNIENNRIISVDNRIKGLLQHCGNINAVREFLTYLVFETFQVKENDFSYHLARLGFIDALNKSKVFSGMNQKEQFKLQKLMQWQINRVRRMCNFICAKLDDSRYKNVLDLGCGIGQLSYQLAKKGMRVTAVDLDIKQAITLQNLITNKYPFVSKVSFEKGNALDLSNINKKYDLITLADVVEHITDKEKLFTATIEKLNNNGVIALHTDNLTKLQLLLFAKKLIYFLTFRNPKSYNLAWSGGEGGHVGLQTPKQLINLLKKFQFESICQYDKDYLLAKISPPLFANGFMLFSVRKGN